MTLDSFGRRLMTRLLERSHPANEELVGDVLEEVEAGRSHAWAWRQTLRAVAEGRWRDLCADPWGAVAAFLVAGAMLVLVGFCLVVAAGLLDRILPGEAAFMVRLGAAVVCVVVLVAVIRCVRGSSISVYWLA